MPPAREVRTSRCKGQAAVAQAPWHAIVPMDACACKHAMLLPACGTAAAAAAAAAPDARLQLQASHGMLHDALGRCKDSIARATTAWRWEAAKRMTNEYELVHSHCPSGGGGGGGGRHAHAFFGRGSHGVVARTPPVSRSFFKLWELLGDYGHEMLPPPEHGRSVVAAFLAEAPGGFVECFIEHRRRVGGSGHGDQLHCMTLIAPQDRRVPTLQQARLQRAAAHIGASLRVHVGADGTGDLQHPANIEQLAASVGERSCDLVTADGGFDFSNDFNAQEADVLPLLVSEVACALRLQRPRGCLVLKMFDVSSDASIALLWALQQRYARVRLVKPLTSRPANSEKYAVCTGHLAWGASAPARLELPLPPAPAWFADAVLEFSAHRVACQVANIAATLAAAATLIACLSPRHLMASAIQWCERYSMPVSAAALRNINGNKTNSVNVDAESHQQSTSLCSLASSSSSSSVVLAAESPSSVAAASSSRPYMSRMLLTAEL